MDERSYGRINVMSQALSRRAFLALGGGSVLVLVAGCTGSSPGSSGTGASPSSSNTLTFAIPSYPGSWDEDFIGFDTVALTLFKNVIPYMVDYSVTSAGAAKVQNTAQIIPTFAESFTPDATGKTWTLRLRKGLVFPSGNELTSEDVKWSKDRAFAAAANVAGIYRLIGLTRPEQVQVIDRYTVRFE